MAEDATTEKLLQLVGEGDSHAIDQLLARHRPRLKQMVAARMTRALTTRLDPSDVVQEALAEAAAKLTEYLEQRRVPFYPWLREIAWLRLLDLSRRHLHSQRRTVAREVRLSIHLADESAMKFANCLIASGTNPSAQVYRHELRELVWTAIEQLNAIDRELLVLRYVEELTTTEIAAILEISERSVRARHRRAMEQMARFIDDPAPGDREA